MSWSLSLTQVFGGCCCNVYSFEELTRDKNIISQTPNLGTTVTLCQFILVSVVSLPSQLDGLRIRKPKIPLKKLLYLMVMFLAVSVLNNSAWRFGISVPVHIVFRSSSSVCSMVVGYFVGGKRYSIHQVLSCVLMTIGTLLVVSQGVQEKGSVSLNYVFLCGIAVLSFASFLGAFMGIYTEQLYKQHGSHWQETLFYTHFLALPMFIVFTRDLVDDINALRQSPGFYAIPKGLAFLGLNSVTQVICASGVNRLAGISSSLTVAVILLARKFVSLALSAYIYGSSFTTQGLVGSSAIVLATIYYTMASVHEKSQNKKKTD